MNGRFYPGPRESVGLSSDEIFSKMNRQTGGGLYY